MQMRRIFRSLVLAAAALAAAGAAGVVGHEPGLFAPAWSPADAAAHGAAVVTLATVAALGLGLAVWTNLPKVDRFHLGHHQDWRMCRSTGSALWMNDAVRPGLPMVARFDTSRHQCWRMCPNQ